VFFEPQEYQKNTKDLYKKGRLKTFVLIFCELLCLLWFKRIL